MKEPDLIFYDGACGLCHWAVVFALRHDAEGGAFRFAPLQGETFAQRLGSEHRADLPDSLLVVDPSGRLYLRSAGIVRILTGLGRPWWVLGKLLDAIPRPIRDLGYDAMALVRHRLLKAPQAACPVVPKELESRFLP